MSRQMLRPGSIHCQAPPSNIAGCSQTLIVSIIAAFVLLASGCSQMYTSDLNELVDQRTASRNLHQRPMNQDDFTVDPDVFSELPAQDDVKRADSIGVADNDSPNSNRRIPATIDESSIVVDKTAFEAAEEARARILTTQSPARDQPAQKKPATPSPIVLKAKTPEPQNRNEGELDVTPLPPQNGQVNSANQNTSSARIQFKSNPLSPITPTPITDDLKRLDSSQIVRSNLLQPIEPAEPDEQQCGDHRVAESSNNQVGENQTVNDSNEFDPVQSGNGCAKTSALDSKPNESDPIDDPQVAEWLTRFAQITVPDGYVQKPKLQILESQDLVQQIQPQWFEQAAIARRPALPGDMPHESQLANQALPIPDPESTQMASPGKDVENDFAVKDLNLQQTIADAASIDNTQIAAFHAEVAEAVVADKSTAFDPAVSVAAGQPPTDISTTVDPPKPIAWDKQLESTIDAFRAQIENTADDAQRNDLRSGLNILQSLRVHLDANHQADFFQNPQHRQYWDHQIAALSELLDQTSPTGDLAGTSSRAVKHLQLAVMQLRDIANLNISVVAFCTRVEGYGQYVPARSTEFQPGQTALIYCELENFLPVVETIGEQTIYRTRLGSRLNVLDETGKVVQQADFPVVEDIARNRRRDFYMHVPVTIGSLSPGNYQLYLTIEDLGGNKTATLESPLVFSVR